MKIIYEDKYFLVINKPAGLVVQGVKEGSLSVLKELKKFIKIRDQKKGDVFLGVVHRLDKVVSGLTIIAKRSKIAKKFLEIFQKKEIIKVYLAVVEGELLGEGLWENYLKWDSFKKKSIVYEKFYFDTKLAITFYKVIHSSKFQSVIFLSPITGRKHQLRAVLEKIGHPIWGDKRYGSQAKVLNGKAILLHNFYLNFPHPLSKETMEFWADIPPYFPKFPLDKRLVWEFLYKIKKFQEEKKDVPG